MRNPATFAKHYALALATDPVARMKLNTRLLEPYWRWRLASFGHNSMIYRPRGIRGGHKITVGSDVVIYHHVWLSAERQTWDKPGIVISIGSMVQMGFGVVVSAGERIEIADHVGIASNCFITDLDHTKFEGSHSAFLQPIVTSPTRIGYSTWVGAGSCILRGSQIGENCVIGAGSIVKGDIPDNSIAVGAPAKVVGHTDDLARDAA